jgi:dTDP-4-amino-4,6-dideoxygalactose transaminase
MKVPFLTLAPAYEELRAQLDRAYSRVMRAGWFILGPEVEAFERAFAAYCGAPHCVGVANGLEAMELVLRAWDIGPGDEVIVPSNTYIATWLAVSRVGARPVPVEPEASTYNIDPGRIEAAITPRTRALVPVHLYGQCADMTSIMQLARARGLLVLEDAAQAAGATHRGKRAGALADAAAFSFYPGKNLGAFGDAGAVVTADARLADRVRVLRNYGSRTKYHNEVQGMNSRLDELHAALLGPRLAVLDAWNARRAKIARLYIDGLSGSGLVLPHVGPGNAHNWHLFVVRTPGRDKLQQGLAGRGVGTMIHYPVPPHLQPAYAQMSLARGAFPVSEAIHDEVLSLPIGPHLTEGEARYVVESVQGVLAAG